MPAFLKHSSRDRGLSAPIVAAAILLPLVIVPIGCQPAQPVAAKSDSGTTATTSTKRDDGERAFTQDVVEINAPIQPPEAEPAPPVRAEPVYRPNDDRPVHDAADLAALGIHTYRSARMTLWTDIAPDAAEPLPPLVDQFYGQLVAGLGPLPPARDGAEFHVYGYLMADEAKFREAGCLPEDLPTFEHGRNRNNVFWMREQPFAYYREHLLLHEVTHCYMLASTHTELYPVWVMEGLAEFYGTHRVDAAGKLHTGILPDSPESAAGFGRISLIRTAFAEQRGKTVAKVLQLLPAEFDKPEAYAWSWGLSHFLLTHPRYGETFRDVLREAPGPGFSRELARRYQSVERDLLSEWMLFVVNLCYGYDTQRAAIDFRPGRPLGETPGACTIRADRGWQSSEILVEAGETYRISATGRVTLADEPKPWVSEPQGITFRYHDGWPLGLLLMCVRSETGLTGGADDSLRQALPVGREAEFTTPVTGTVYLRVNDGWNSLADNTGSFEVTLNREPPPRASSAAKTP